MMKYDQLKNVADAYARLRFWKITQPGGFGWVNLAPGRVAVWAAYGGGILVEWNWGIYRNIDGELVPGGTATVNTAWTPVVFTTISGVNINSAPENWALIFSVD